MGRMWREQKGAALVEYVLILPMVLLLFLGTLEIFRLLSIKQSLRTGLKQAAPCLSHWKDTAYESHCNPYLLISAELDKNPFAIGNPQPRLVPADVGNLRYGDVFAVTAEIDVEFGYLYPFPGGPTITIRESTYTFIDSSPEYYELNIQTPFPNDPGAVP